MFKGTLISIVSVIVGLLFSVDVRAHVSEQGLVLLLPTDFYTASGVLVVVLTLALVACLPLQASQKIFNSIRLWPACSQTVKLITSIFSTIFLFFLLYIGFTSSYDPLENPLPLFIWTVWWVGFVLLQGLLGDLWSWVEPWSGVASVVNRYRTGKRLSLPGWLGQWPAVLLFLLFISYSLADPTPAEPVKLAVIVSIYWCFTFGCVLLFGSVWLEHGECFSIMLKRFSQLAVIGTISSRARFGLQGFLAVNAWPTSVSAAVFILVLLGCGSFDGLNETFFWLSSININPLDFPGRSAIVMETVLGLLLTNTVLIVVYGVCIYAGLKFARIKHRSANALDAVTDQNIVTFKQAFCALSISVLPIAFAYHFAHFLTSFMVNIQYVVKATSDPFSNGSDLLGIGSYYVTTGFLNSPQSVKLIWLSQAAAVVVGHVLSVLMGHAIAVELFGSGRRGIVSQVPLALFMVFYTFIGLWLLAAPKGG